MQKIVVIVILLFGFLPNTIDAAPDPMEVKEIKSNAPLHLIGKVTTDLLVADTTEDNQHPTQRRKMIIRINDIIKKPDDIKIGDNIAVFYSYIPSWNADQYAGGARMDIMVGDVIEIWLEQKDGMWISALTGNTVEHIRYIEPRQEPIPEPLLHKWKFNVFNFFELYIEQIVLFGLILLLISMISFRLRSLKK